MSTEVSSFFFLPEISFSTLQKEQLFHAFVSRLFLRVGVRWRARVRAGPVVLQKKKEKKEKKGEKKKVRCARKKKEKEKKEKTFFDFRSSFSRFSDFIEKKEKKKKREKEEEKEKRREIIIHSCP